MREIKKERRFSRLPFEVRERLSGRGLSKDDFLFCIFNARSRDHAWLSEFLWGKFLWNDCDKDDCLFLMEHCSSLDIQACNKFLGFYPTNSELQYAKEYARNDEVKTLIGQAIARRSDNVVELKPERAIGIGFDPREAVAQQAIGL